MSNVWGAYQLTEVFTCTYRDEYVYLLKCLPRTKLCRPFGTHSICCIALTGLLYVFSINILYYLGALALLLGSRPPLQNTIKIIIFAI